MLGGRSRSSRRGWEKRCRIFLQHSAERGAVAAYFQREHGATGDLQRGELHDGKEVDRPARGSVQCGDGFMRRLHDMASEQRHDARREGGRDGAALKTPVITLG